MFEIFDAKLIDFRPRLNLGVKKKVKHRFVGKNFFKKKRDS